MKAEPVSKTTRITVETSASASLDEVFRWLLECRANPLRLEAEHLPSLGQGARLMLAVPMTAQRAILCALTLLEEGAAGACLLSGQLRFVADPHGPDVTLSFSGHAAMSMASGFLYRRAHHAVGELLQLIAESIPQPAITRTMRVAV
jgi:hypothetical protein